MRCDKCDELHDDHTPCPTVGDREPGWELYKATRHITFPEPDSEENNT